MGNDFHPDGVQDTFDAGTENEYLVSTSYLQNVPAAYVRRHVLSSLFYFEIIEQ